MSQPRSLLEHDVAATVTPRANAVGLGCALPAHVVANHEIATNIGVGEGWIERRTGIRARRHTLAEMTLLELAVEASQAALDDAGTDASSLDLVVVATVSQERRLPNVAPQLAAALGAQRAGAFDLGAACAGFVTGLAVSSALIEAGRALTALVVGADTLSRYTDPFDKRTAALFGDGAGAVVLAAGDAGGVSVAELATDGGASELIVTDPVTDLIQMDGQETFRLAVATLERDVRRLCARAELDPASDIDLFVFHQANGRITRSVCDRLELRAERVVDSIAEVGNTSAASIPLALEHARRDGRLRTGSRLLLGSVGAGFISAAALMEWGRP